MNITTPSSTTIITIELRTIINGFRKEHGEPTVENSHFVKRVEDELEGELGGSKTFRPTGYTVDELEELFQSI